MAMSPEDDAARRPAAVGAGGGRGTVEAPIWSPGWSRFFGVAAVAVVLLGLWQLFAVPSLGARLAEQRADEAAARAAASPGPAERDEWMAEAARLRELASQLRADRSRASQPLQGLAWFALILAHLARRLRTKTARQVLDADFRAPVIYFRSFLSDALDEAAIEARAAPLQASSSSSAGSPASARCSPSADRGSDSRTSARRASTSRRRTGRRSPGA